MGFSYVVRPIPGAGSVIHINSGGDVNEEVEEKLSEISSKAFIDVQEAVAGSESFELLERLQQIRGAAKRQLGWYEKWWEDEIEFRARIVERGVLDKEEVEEPTIPDDYRAAIHRTLSMLATCDWLEGWFLETGEIPTRKDTRQINPFENTRTRYGHCKRLIDAYNERAPTVESMGDLWGLMGNHASRVEKAVRDTLKAAGREPEGWDPISYMTHLIEVVERHQNTT